MTSGIKAADSRPAMVEIQANPQLMELQKQLSKMNIRLENKREDVRIWVHNWYTWMKLLENHDQIQWTESWEARRKDLEMKMLCAEYAARQEEQVFDELQRQIETLEMEKFQLENRENEVLRTSVEFKTPVTEASITVENFPNPLSDEESEAAVITDLEDSPTSMSMDEFTATVLDEHLSGKTNSSFLNEIEVLENTVNIPVSGVEKDIDAVDDDILELNVDEGVKCSSTSCFPVNSESDGVVFESVNKDKDHLLIDGLDDCVEYVRCYDPGILEMNNDNVVEIKSSFESGHKLEYQCFGNFCGQQNNVEGPVFSVCCKSFDPGIFKNRGSEPYKKWFKDHGVSEKSCECAGGINCEEGKIVNVLLPENSSLEIVGFPSVWIFEDMLKKIGQNNCEVTELEVGFGADKVLKLLKCYEMSRVDEGLKWIDSAMIFDPGICVGILRSFGVHSTPKRMGVGESSGKIIVGRTRNKTKVTEFCLWNEWSSEINSLDAFSSEWQSIEQNKMVEICMVLCSFDRGKMNDDGSKRFGMNSAETRNSVKTWLDRSMFFFLENLSFLVIIEPSQVQHKEVMNCGNLRMLQWYTALKSDDENDVCIVAVQFSVYAADHNSKNASWHKRRSLVCMRFCRPWDKYASSFKGGTQIVDMRIYNKKQVAEEQFTGTAVDPNYSVAGLFFFPSNFSLRSSCYLRRREIYEINECVLGILGSVDFLDNAFELGTCNLLVPGAVCLFSSKGFWGCVSRDGTDGARSMTVLIFVLHSCVMHENDYSKGSSSGGDQGKKGLTLEFLEDDESMVRRKISSGGDHSSTSMFSKGRSWMNQATQSEEIFGVSKQKQVQLHDKYEIAAERPELHLSCVHRFIPFHLHWSWQRHFCKEFLELLVSRFHRATAVKEETAKYALRIFVGMVKAQTSVAQFCQFFVGIAKILHSGFVGVGCLMEEIASFVIIVEEAFERSGKSVSFQGVLVLMEESPWTRLFSGKGHCLGAGTSKDYMIPAQDGGKSSGNLLLRNNGLMWKNMRGHWEEFYLWPTRTWLASGKKNKLGEKASKASQKNQVTGNDWSKSLIQELEDKLKDKEEGMSGSRGLSCNIDN